MFIVCVCTADVNAMYRNALTRTTTEYHGKTLKRLNKLITSNADRFVQLSKEIGKQRVDKEAWKQAYVPDYFSSEWGMQFLAENATNNANYHRQHHHHHQQQQQQNQQHQHQHSTMSNSQGGDRPQFHYGKPQDSPKTIQGYYTSLL